MMGTMSTAILIQGPRQHGDIVGLSRSWTKQLPKVGYAASFRQMR